MSDSAVLGDDVAKVVEKIQKMLKLAANNPSEAEAAAATAKAQEMLAKYNLQMADVERAEGKDGKREQMKTKGGLYKFQRSLWEAVANLNFCLYFGGAHMELVTKKRKNWDGSTVEVKKWVQNFRHHVVGRTVNIAATTAMAGYLEQTIERITREHMKDPKEYFTRYANSFREGMTYSIVQKIYQRRAEILQDEASRKAAAAHAATGSTEGSASMGLTLAVYIDEETDANYDLLHGPGTSARWAAMRAQQAAEAKAEEERYTRWAAENPEEAAAEKAKREAEAKKARRGGSGSRGGGKQYDYGAWQRGREAGKSVSIDQQMGDAARKVLK